MSMTPTQYTDWKTRYDAALSAYATAATAKKDLHETNDSRSARTFQDSADAADAAVVTAGASIDSLNAEFSAAAAVPMDVVSPTVVATLPGNKEGNVAINVSVVVQFSEELDVSTVTSGNLYLKNSDGSAASLSYSTPVMSQDGKSATMVISSNLLNNHTYKIFASSNIKDKYGNALEGGFIQTDGFLTVPA